MTDQEILRKCYAFAKDNSPDPSTQLAAAVMSDGGFLYPFACNKFPSQIRITPERLADRETKLFYTTHAEVGAIFAAIRQSQDWADGSLDFRNCTLYGTWVACDACARSIIESGIRNVVTHQLTQDLTPDRWKPSIKAALAMLEEAGVDVRFYDGPIGDVSVRFNGQIIHP